jgi:DNA repair protein RadC
MILSCQYREIADMMLELCEGEERVSLPSEAATVFRELIGNRRNEHFAVMLLNGAHKAIGTLIVTQGLVNKTLINPSEIFRPAIMADAVAVIVAHNHPSGQLEPSPEDRSITDRLRDAGKIIGISLIDHLIVSRSGFYSFADNGGIA